MNTLKNKTNMDLLAELIAIVLIILIIICGCVSGWMGIIHCICGYLFSLITGCLIIAASNKINEFNEWSKQELDIYRVLGFKFKFFSKYGRI